MRLQKSFAILAAWSCLFGSLQAQQPFVERPHNKIVWRPYMKPTVPPVVLTNSERIHGLIRAGRLYLTVQDAIALAIENNLDLQVDRYGPLRADWYVERQQAGGPLKGSTSNQANSSPVIAGQGVRGAESAAGVLANSGSGSGSGQNGGFTQIGPVTPNLDPTVYGTYLWGHTTYPQANLQISGTESLVDISRNFSNYAQEGFLSGTVVQTFLQENYLKENSPGDALNPSVQPRAYVYAYQKLLSGRGMAVNSRYIKMAKKSAEASRVTFRSQVLNLVAQVVNVYWDLVGYQQDRKAKQEALDFADKFYNDTQKQIELGAIAKVDIYRAEAELATSKQDLATADLNVSQQEVTLKSLISRDGAQDPELDAAQIVTLDRLEVPTSDDLPPLRELVATALKNRPDVLLDKINNESQEINSVGTVNAILPSATVYGYSLNTGSAGSPNPISPYRPLPSQIGGLGDALGQVFSNQYNTRVGGLNFSGPLRNRSDQADLGIDQMQLRQGDLQERKNRNDMVVAISNGMIAVRQASLRYRNAVASRELQQQLLTQEQQKFRLGSSTIDLVIAAQRALTSAQYAEIAALQNYSRSRVGLDQTLGTTLETNNVSVDEAMKGTVGYESKLPADVK